MVKIDYLIIGSGPSGIGAALGLERDYLVLESSYEIGGFSSTIELNGAVFDLGGHSFHTPHPEIKELVYSSIEMHEQKRDAQCFHDGELIQYPFQKNFNSLTNTQIVNECRQGLSACDDGKNSAHFEEYIERRFGFGIAKHFMLPYNRKLWGRDLRRLAADWTGERVAAPLGIGEKFETEGGNRRPLQSDTVIAYPAKGGFGEIFKALGKRVKNIEFGKAVEAIDFKRKIVYTTEKQAYKYKYLISTIPIIKLVNIIQDIPPHFIEISKNLDFLSLKLGLIVINHPVDTPIQRIYSAEDIIPAHKIALNHNSSDYLRRLPKHGIMMEISEGPEKKILRNDMEKWIIDSLLKVRIIKTISEVEKIYLKEAKFAYPVPTHNRDSIVDNIQTWLINEDIYSVGRFGQWAYINSDEAIFRGFKIGREISSMA